MNFLEDKYLYTVTFLDLINIMSGFIKQNKILFHNESLIKLLYVISISSEDHLENQSTFTITFYLM